MACLEGSSVRRKRTEFWFSRAGIVGSVARRSNMSMTKLHKTDKTFTEMPVSGWTCLRNSLVTVGHFDVTCTSVGIVLPGFGRQGKTIDTY
ncbi:BZ3500_MvSof-1268-A1-R1_Chr3-1g05879 [Microbotryum saponariae]|uniref:BZ3500_MvSof-1268-A1-R1_Chr3-1g05879 protein n=1 Tax=Microbotryum saponariae TaxID=289078 RepID=A0A2X0L2Z2_9BASI|nr:BZ3500_MvSof-1268-A1-R1_Chr3-1g05879 [Microbotryum saponariae]SDA05069.1 BZ3501_MvSof-1269-A2-R1_Chr3-1g05549 [Microbotryum saponariae]